MERRLYHPLSAGGLWAQGSGAPPDQLEPAFWELIQSRLRPFQHGGVTREDIARAADQRARPREVDTILIYNNSLYTLGAANKDAANHVPLLRLLCM